MGIELQADHLIHGIILMIFSDVLMCSDPVLLTQLCCHVSAVSSKASSSTLSVMIKIVAENGVGGLFVGRSGYRDSSSKTPSYLRLVS